MSSLSLHDIGPHEINYQLSHWDDNRGYVVDVMTSIFFVLALVFVILRLIARKLKQLSWQPDDYLIVAALVSRPLPLGRDVA